MGGWGGDGRWVVVGLCGGSWVVVGDDGGGGWVERVLVGGWVVVLNLVKRKYLP